MPRPVPLATYRVQLTSAFGFAEAAKLVPYLKALGVTHLYTSPITQARPGSTHGYDVIDHNKLNPELGGAEGFATLTTALTKADLGLITDFVPNHVGIGHGVNAWWLDVLEWGRNSPHAASFDIDWSAFADRPHGAVLLPILGKPYGDTLESGEIEIRYDPKTGSISAWYFDHKLPISPIHYGEVIATALDFAGTATQPERGKLSEIATRYRTEPPTHEQSDEVKAALKQSGAAEILSRGLTAYKPDNTDPSRTERLHHLLDRQHYRLAHWRLAATEINYRRFFDITELAGIRVENPATFEATHKLTGELIAAGHLQGLRLDHIDGLYDPQQYCRRLQRLIRVKRPAADRMAPFYVVVEKILADDEAMPKLTGVAGTTGYDTANFFSRVMLDESGLRKLRALAQEITGTQESFAETLEAAKLQVLNTMLASEFNVLAPLLARIATEHWRSRDFTLARLRDALRLYVLHFPVYRTMSPRPGLRRKTAK